MSPDNLPLMTAVIPISRLRDDTNSLAEWMLADQLKNITLIFVFDCCKPTPQFESMLIDCKANQVKVELGEFNGPGLARNHGLNLVETDWVCFWDSDDLPLVENAVLALHQLASKDAVIGICEFETAKSTPTGDFTDVFQVVHTSESLFQIAANPGLWRFIFRTSVVEDLKFPQTRMGEDQVFLTRSLKKKPQILWLRIPIYRYVRHEQPQLTNTASAISELIDSANIIFEEIGLRNSDDFKQSIPFLIKQCITIFLKSSILIKVKALIILGRITIANPWYFITTTIKLIRELK